MKKVSLRVLSLLLLLMYFTGFSQETNWVDKMMAPNGNFYDIQDQFYQDWDGYEYERGKGWKQFHRWEYFWETRILPDGSFPDFNRKWDELKAFQNQSRVMNQYGGDWSPLGPFSHSNTGSWSPGQGRVNCIIEHPFNSSIIFIGAPVGGIWKTIDDGVNWTPVSDQISSIGIASIAISASNPSIMYAATGDPDGGDTFSVGVLKSTDGGDTWSEVGNVPFELKDILVDPMDENLVYIAATNGVHKSVDGGQNWNLIRTGNTRNIKFKPGDPQTIYAISSSDFYSSIDGGQNWITAIGLDSTASRVTFDVTEADPNLVYLSIAGSGNVYRGVYRSTDGGLNFTLRDSTVDIFDGSSQAWYDMAICVSDTDPNILVHGLLNLWESNDGGLNWSSINSWNNSGGAAYTHADIHFLDYQNGRLYCGSDGGIYRSTNNSTSFTDLTQGIQIGQFYTIAGAESDVNRISGGLQDNGGYTWDGNGWNVYYGADGMESAVKESNPSQMYGMIQYGTLRYSNGGNNSTSLGSPEEGAWVTPMQYDNQNSRVIAGYNDLYEYNGGWNQISTTAFGGLLRHIELYGSNTNIMLVGNQYKIWKSTDGGVVFTEITNNLTNLLAGNRITSIEIDPNNDNRIWVSVSGWTLNHKIMYTDDSGLTWQNQTLVGNFPNITCNIIKYDPSSSNNSLYAGTDDGVYYYNDNIGHWIPYSTHLPNTIVNDIEINETNNMIRIGSYGRGVWESETYPDNLVDEDAGVTSILHPIGDVCGVNIAPNVIVRNFGLNNLYSLILKYQIDNNPYDSIVWNGNLTSYDSLIISIPSFSSSGTHDFKAWTELPNSIMDSNPENDTSSVSFTVITGDQNINFQLTEDCMGSEITWSVVDIGSNVVLSGGPYTDGNEGLTHAYGTCVSFGCYDLIVVDAGGDGLSGSQINSYGCTLDGNYLLTVENGDTLSEMGMPNFGSSQSENFCLTEQVPVADFTVDIQNTCTDLTINFEDISSGFPNSWTWTFLGGIPASSNSSNPHVTYSSPGIYEVILIVTNGSGTDTKTESTFITVNQSPTLNLTPYNVDCFNNCNGSISSSITNGTSPYDYLWSNNASLDSIFGLCPDNYTSLITDANGCSDYTQVSISEPISLEVISDTTQSDCNLDNGQVILTISGGTVPYVEDWGTEDPNNLSAGLYYYTVTDINNCENTGSALIENINMPELNITTQNIDCNGDSTGTVSLIVTNGTPPIMVNWYGIDVNNLYAGNYPVTILDNVGCEVNDNFWIYETTTINMTPTVTDEMFGADGIINMAVNGGALPFSYLWSNGETTRNISGLLPGSYTLSVIDGKQCDTSITVFVGTQLSIEENEFYGIHIYPNPVASDLILPPSSEDIFFDLYLIDSRGKIVYSKGNYNLMSGLKINMNTLNSGLYMLKMVGQNEKYNFKIIKQ